MKKERAVRTDLWDFFGDPARIRRVWAQALKKPLQALPPEELRDLQDELFPHPCDEETINDICSGKDVLITTSTFRRLAIALGLKIQDYLKFTSPVTEEERRHYRKEMEARGAKVAAASGNPAGGSDELPDLSVEAYLFLRALGQLEMDPPGDKAVAACSPRAAG